MYQPTVTMMFYIGNEADASIVLHAVNRSDADDAMVRARDLLKPNDEHTLTSLVLERLFEWYEEYYDKECCKSHTNLRNPTPKNFNQLLHQRKGEFLEISFAQPVAVPLAG